MAARRSSRLSDFRRNVGSLSKVRMSPGDRAGSVELHCLLLRSIKLPSERTGVRQLIVTRGRSELGTTHLVRVAIFLGLHTADDLEVTESAHRFAADLRERVPDRRRRSASVRSAVPTVLRPAITTSLAASSQPRTTSA